MKNCEVGKTNNLNKFCSDIVRAPDLEKETLNKVTALRNDDVTS